MKWDNMKKYSPLGLSIISSLFTILGLIVHGKWDTDTERYIDELALLIFQMFPILYYRDINGTKGKPAVLGGIVFQLAFGISLFLLG
jgi:hypothetical protein